MEYLCLPHGNRRRKNMEYTVLDGNYERKNK